MESLGAVGSSLPGGPPDVILLPPGGQGRVSAKAQGLCVLAGGQSVCLCLSVFFFLDMLVCSLDFACVTFKGVS